MFDSRLSAYRAPVVRVGWSGNGGGTQRRRSGAYMDAAIDVSNDSPVLLDRFLDLATEVDVDCI